MMMISIYIYLHLNRIVGISKPRKKILYINIGPWNYNMLKAHPSSLLFHRQDYSKGGPRNTMNFCITTCKDEP